MVSSGDILDKGKASLNVGVFAPVVNPGFALRYGIGNNSELHLQSSILSHEINNPLSSIKMASQLILKSKKYDEELHKIVVNETERISKIFKSISYM